MKIFGFLLASAVLAVSASAQDIDVYQSGGYNIIPGLNSDVYVQRYSYRGKVNSSHSKYMYRGSVSGYVTPSYNGFWNGRTYVPGYSYDPVSRWGRYQYQAGSLWVQPGYVPPHLNEPIR